MKKPKPNSCCICGRQLTDPSSIARGSGDECATKRAAFIAGIGASEAELRVITENLDPEVAKLARFIFTDMRNGDSRSASHWIGSARLKMGDSFLRIEDSK